ncbi:MAG: hypothetical protein Q9M30_00280 [Mariprofundaceae bacterium]|nr:hypothetical protein [Mariprofundaceae bacterium]
MQNTVMASIEFYFRGERIAPEALIDLDECLRQENPTPAIYRTLASENRIGIHSHEFDVMILEDIVFSCPAGLACGFVHDGALDLTGLRCLWQQEKIISRLQPIARKHLGIENLDEHPAVKAALIEAFEAR